MLTAKQYKKNLKYKLNTKDKIDSVVFEPYVNDITEQTLYTETISSVKVNGNNVSLSSLYSNPGNYMSHIVHVVRNEGKETLTTPSLESAKGRVGVLFGLIEKTVTLSQPLANNSNITVNLSYSHSSDIVTRGNKSYTNMPTWTNLQNRSYDLASWVRTNKAQTLTDDPKWLWNSSIFPFNPFVRTPVEYNSEINLPSSSEVLTRWYTGASQYPATGNWNAGAKYSDWKDENVYYDNNYAKYFTQDPLGRYFQDVEYGDDAASNVLLTPYFGFRCLGVSNSSIVPRVNYTVQDTTHIKVSIMIPIRFEYCAASRGYTGLTHSTLSQIDSYAFVDYVNEVELEIKGLSLVGNESVVIYGLDNNDNVVEVAEKGIFPYIVNKNEFITVNATWRDVGPLTEKLAGDLLEAYKKGKITFVCDVYYDWFLSRGLKIDDYEHITTVDNKIITKDGNIVTFQLKNIKKRYSQGEYIVELGFLESNVDVSIVNLVLQNDSTVTLYVTSATTLSELLTVNNISISDVVSISVSGNIDFTIDTVSANLEVLDLRWSYGETIIDDDLFYGVNANLTKVDLRGNVIVGNNSFDSVTIETLFYSSKTTLLNNASFQQSSIDKVYFDGIESVFLAMVYGDMDSDPTTMANEVYIRSSNGRWVLYRGSTIRVTYICVSDDSSHTALGTYIVSVSSGTYGQNAPSITGATFSEVRQGSVTGTIITNVIVTSSITTVYALYTVSQPEPQLIAPTIEISIN